MQIRYAIGKDQYKRMSTEELRQHFLVEKLFLPRSTELIYWETDRTVLGGIVPVEDPLRLENDPALSSDFFCERRELAAFNLGGTGEVTVDGKSFPLESRDAIYAGRGSREISFSSSDKERPARFFLISYPAQVTHPTTLIPRDSANRIELGSTTSANQRSLHQYLHQKGAQSCQLVAGMTHLKEGSVWNTMPPHTHLRRSEVYFYFNLPESAAVIHLMGPGDETRHLMVHSDQAVLSPIWSTHCGCGSEAYSFIWAMGGENQDFNDMDHIPISNLR